MFALTDHITEFSVPMLSMSLIDRGGLWTLVGFVILGWVMARMTVQRRKRRVRDERDDKEMKARFDSTSSTALPLSDAPLQTRRWEVAMFDLQRELKGELDSRIAVTQSLIRQLDQRIATIKQLEEK